MAFHGGQEWVALDTYIEDLSVTTNGLGPPIGAVQAARDAIASAQHYPALSFEPQRSELAQFMWGGQSEARRVLLGNGASELIDLLIRHAASELAKEGAAATYSPGPSRTQYKEYERSARAAGFSDLEPRQRSRASLVCMVNPNNPTGDYMALEQIMAWIEGFLTPASHAETQRRVHILVDESMLMWHGPSWARQSLASQHEWLAGMAARNVHVFVIHSWTKIFACPGLRLGSCVCPTAAAAERVRMLQPPWSVNSPALAFLSEALRDQAFLEQTWEATPLWGRAARNTLSVAFPSWKLHGPLWASWLWVDTGSEAALQAALSRARTAGLPIRSGAAGYDHPTCFRMAIRKPEVSLALVAALRGQTINSQTTQASKL